MELFVFAILLTVKGAQQSQLEGPQNTLSIVGSTATLKCSSPSRNCIGIDWQKFVHGASPMTISKAPGRLLNVVDRDRYSVNDSSGCDLVIRNVKLTDAGRFICSAIFSARQETKTAHLIILKSQLKCTTNASQENTAEGDRVRMTCELTYNGTSSASMIWFGVDNAVLGGTSTSRSYIVAASAPEVLPYKCNASFADETRGIVGFALNTPVTTCETLPIKVLYSVRNVTLSPSLSYYSSESVIYCTAKGRPLPTCKWQEMENGRSWMDAQNQNSCKFTTPSVSSKRYRCVAMNNVKGQSYNAASNEILVNNTGSAAAATMNGSLLGLPLMVWIAGGSGAGGLLLLIILIVICCCVRACPGYKCCHSRSKSNDKIRDEKSLDTYVYSTANPKKNVRPKAQPRPAAAVPCAPSKRPPAPLPKNTERTGN